MNKKLLKCLLGVLSLTFLSACGREVQLSIKTDEKERSQPSTALVRKIEITYQDPSGKEQLHHQVPVTGLGQPVTIEKDILGDLDVEDGGTFKASAYGGEGGLLLRGHTLVDTAGSDVIEISLSRVVDPLASDSVLSSAIFKSIHFEGSQGRQTFLMEDVRASLVGRGCLAVPEIHLDPSFLNSIWVETAVRGTVAKVKVEEVIENESIFIDEVVLSLNHNAFPELVLSSKFKDGFFFKKARRLKLHFFSNENEGCIEFTASPSLNDIQVYKEFGPLWKWKTHRYEVDMSSANFFGVTFSGLSGSSIDVHFFNPNPFSVTVTATINVKTEKGPQLACSSMEKGSFSIDVCRAGRKEGFTVPAKSTRILYVYGYRRSESVSSDDIFKDIELSGYSLDVQSVFSPEGGSDVKVSAVVGI